MSTHTGQAEDKQLDDSIMVPSVTSLNSFKETGHEAHSSRHRSLEGESWAVFTQHVFYSSFQSSIPISIQTVDHLQI